MANRTTPWSSNYNGWFYDAVTPAHKLYNRGTLVMTVAATAITTAGTLATGGLATFASATTTGNHTFSGTITNGDSVGADGEQFTSGGAAAVCDWA
jgi:hypothetical protein